MDIPKDKKDKTDKIVPQLRKLARKALNSLIPTENLSQSKKKWNSLAAKNSAYYIMTDFGEGITEEQFRASGEKDYIDLVEHDEILRQRLSPFSEKDVLEIGCGTGRISEFIAGHFHKTTGIDISEEMIGQARKRLSYINNVSFEATDGTRIPFNDGSFDMVFSFIVFQHMPDKMTVAKNLKEVSRVLRKGGIAKIQLRGLPTSKKNWFYGPSFSLKDVQEILHTLPFKLLKSEGENSRYFWVWLLKD